MLLELAFQRHTSCLREDERHPKRTGIIIFGCTNRKRGRTMNPADIAFIIICTGPVSYTHLDVYKRQVWAGLVGLRTLQIKQKERLDGLAVHGEL